LHVERFRIVNNGKGYKVAKTPNVDQLLNQKNYSRVAYQKLKENIAYAETEMWLDNDTIYARSIITRGIDDLDRPIFTNDTLLIRVKDLAQRAVQTVNFDALFNVKPPEGTRVLEPLEV
jgi:hypothetical protein